MLGNEVGSVIVPTLQMRKLRPPAEKHLPGPGQSGILCSKPHWETFGLSSSETRGFCLIPKFNKKKKEEEEEKDMKEEEEEKGGNSFRSNPWQQVSCYPCDTEVCPRGLCPRPLPESSPMSAEPQFFREMQTLVSATQWLFFGSVGTSTPLHSLQLRLGVPQEYPLGRWLSETSVEQLFLFAHFGQVSLPQESSWGSGGSHRSSVSSVAQMAAHGTWRALSRRRRVHMSLLCRPATLPDSQSSREDGRSVNG